MFRTEVKTASLPVSQFLDGYCRPVQFCPLCKDCPDYGRVWSCPPGVPDAQALLAPYRTVCLIGVKVIYGSDLRDQAVSSELTEHLRRESYGVVKRNMLKTLLCLEDQCSGSLTISAGRCELCRRCAREDGRSCYQPQRMRYSFSSLGFDLARISEELLGAPLLWASEGLPEYNMAIYAFLPRSSGDALTGRQ